MRLNGLKFIKIFLTLLVCVGVLSSCALENRATVPPKTERITLQREFFWTWRTECLPEINGPWTMQKYNHGNGPTVAYDFDMSIQNYTVTLNVKTLDNINLPVTLEVSWQMKTDSTLIAALNFLPSDRIGKVISIKDGKAVVERFTPGTADSIEYVTVPIALIFERNIQHYLDEVGRDVIDRQLSKNFKREVVALDIKRALEERLNKIRLPETTYDPNVGVIFPDVKYEGIKLIHSGSTVSVLDIIEVNRIMVRHVNPDFINDKITEINELEAEVTGLRAALSQWSTKSATKLKTAQHARKTAINIGKALEANPLMPQLQRLNNWKVIIANAKKGTNTRFRFVPEEMFGKTNFNFGSGAAASGVVTSKKP